MFAIADDWIDLADRKGDGLEIVLLWSRTTQRVKVCVRHVVTGRGFDLDVRADDALNAFYHPFAHAADRERRSRAAVTDLLEVRAA